MTAHPIRILGDPVLHRPAAPVSSYDGALQRLVADLTETMRAANGVGLAAPQIGVGLRVFVYDCPDSRGMRRSGHVINPVLQIGVVPPGLPDEDEDIEGCLSVPGEHFPTARSRESAVTGTDADGEPITVIGSGLLAVCLQHESDHLDGVLYVDRLVGRYRRAARRAIRAHGWGEGEPRTWQPGVDPDPFGHGEDDPPG